MPSELQKASRIHRHLRIRKKVFGSLERPRLVVHRGAKNITAQIIDDTRGITLVASASYDKNLRGKIKKGGNVEAAKMVGEQIAILAKEKSVTQVVFDRGGYLFHGRIKALADAARAKGLQF